MNSQKPCLFGCPDRGPNVPPVLRSASRSCNSPVFLPLSPVLIIIGIQWLTLIVDEVLRTDRCVDLFEGYRGLVEVEAIRKIVRERIGISQRRQTECLFDHLENTSEIVHHMRNVGWLGVRRDDNQGYTEAVFIGVQDRRGNVIVPTSPVIPGDEDGGILPIRTTADSIYDGRYPRRTRAVVDRRMI